MIAMYRANPDAFGGNINILRRGAVLRVYPVTPGVPQDDAIAAARVRAAADRLAPEAALADLRYAYRLDPETDDLP